MPSPPNSLVVKQTVNAPPGAVYRAFTHPTALRDWLADAVQVRARKGGPVYLWWDSGAYAAGVFTRLDPEKKIAFTWQHSAEPEPAKIEVTLKPAQAGTAVRLKHSGGSGRQWKEVLLTAQAAWQAALENLASVLETGVDLRRARLPRLGVMTGEFNEGIAAHLGVPVTEGVRLEGTAEGTGAHHAGLQKDDVLVRLAGKRVTDFNSLGNALQGKQAGDVVTVVLYRGSEKMTAKLELSTFPQPQLPETAQALAALAAEKYAGLNATLARLYAGVSEAEADFRPAPGEWTLKEILAHFVACERDLQSWVAELVNDGNNAGEAQDSLEYRPNVTPRLQALAARYPTVPELLAELERSQAETTALLAALPPEFVARKHLFRRAAEWVMEYVYEGHAEEHHDQIQNTLAAARGAG